MQTGPLENPQNNKSRFREITLKICEILATEGIRARPWNAEDLPYFSRFSPENRLALLHYLEIYLVVIEEISRARGSLLNSCRRQTTRFLELAGLSPTPDLVDHLVDGDFLAAYSREQQMIFVSPNHLQHMSYSIEDLYCRPWVTMFRRQERFEKTLLTRAFEFLSGQRRSTLSNLDIPPHVVTEIDSEERRTATVQSRLYSPLFNDDLVVGFISINCPLMGVRGLVAR